MKMKKSGGSGRIKMPPVADTEPVANYGFGGKDGGDLR